YALAASLDFGLQITHSQKVIARESQVKAKQVSKGQKKLCPEYGHFGGQFRSGDEKPLSKRPRFRRILERFVWRPCRPWGSGPSGNVSFQIAVCRPRRTC